LTLIIHWLGPPLFLSMARIAQLVKSADLQLIDPRFEPHRRRGVFWYGPLAGPSLRIAIMAWEHHISLVSIEGLWVGREVYDNTTSLWQIQYPEMTQPTDIIPRDDPAYRYNTQR